MNLFFIPQPQRCICLTGSADIGRETPVVLCMPQPDERLVLAAGKLFEHVRTEQGPFALYSENSFAPECPVRRPEGYLLNVRGPAVQLAAHDAPGLFYGIQTLRQYLEMPEHPAMEINDWPELAMRSDYLDMRGLFPKFENLLKYVEEMARYKLNTLVIEYEDKLPRSRKEFCHPLDAGAACAAFENGPRPFYRCDPAAAELRPFGVCAQAAGVPASARTAGGSRRDVSASGRLV